jgi:hypothetical protein
MTPRRHYVTDDGRRAVRKLADLLTQLLDPAALDLDTLPGVRVSIAAIDQVISDTIGSSNIAPAASVEALELVARRLKHRIRALEQAQRAVARAIEREQRVAAIADGVDDVRDRHHLDGSSKVRRLERQARALFRLEDRQRGEAFRDAILELAHAHGFQDKPRLAAKRPLKALPPPSKEK